jgi:hypothetical protein
MLERLKNTSLNLKIRIQIAGDGMLYGEKREVTDKPPQWWLVITGKTNSDK